MFVKDRRVNTQQYYTGIGVKEAPLFKGALSDLFISYLSAIY